MKDKRAMNTRPHQFAASTLCALMLVFVLSFGLGACARSTGPETEISNSRVNDPLEPVNRTIFSFNNIVDIAVIEPLADVYNTITPQFFRDGLKNFFRNLRAPLYVANNLLQGEVGDAGIATARFVINTTAGIGGLVDVAEAQGLRHRDEDLGQTLGVWGFGEGVYLVLPIIGPSTLRDTVGMVGDGAADPLRIWAFDTDNEWIYYTRNITEGFTKRAALADSISDLRRNSLDYYATMRSAFIQKRNALIRNQSTQTPTSAFDFPDYDE